MLSSVSFRSAAQDLSVESLKKEPYIEGITLKSNWNSSNLSFKELTLDKSKNIAPSPILTLSSYAYLIHIDKIDKKGYGGALNLKYYSGLPYDYLRKKLPGKTMYVDVYIPKESVSPNAEVPNRLRVTIKSEKDGKWADYYDGSEWRRVTKEGFYHFEIKIPEKALKMETGKTFYPDYATLVCVEYFLLEGSAYHPYLNFYFTNFRIDGIAINPDDLKWQMMKNGYAVKDEFLPSVTAGSSIMGDIGNGSALRSDGIKNNGSWPAAHITNDNLYISAPVFIPKELRGPEGAAALIIKDAKTERSVVKTFDSCNAEGKVTLTLPFKGFSEEKNLEEAVKNKKIDIRISTRKAHHAGMEPIVVEPVGIKVGRLIAFDNKWKVRDVQGLGGYPYIEIRNDNATNGIAVKELADNLYQLEANIRLKGGIDWKNPYYRVELMRPFDGSGADMENMRLEVTVSPLTKTTDMWQRPYRARLGLLDFNNKIMFGPNFSLSDGISKTLYLNVSTSNPIARGIIMDGFDEHNVKAILINIEATHSRVEAKDMKLLFSDLVIKLGKDKKPVKPVDIDFSRFKRNVKDWEITKLIKNRGGYLVGINYPFPVVDIGKDVMEVPQVYPTVGKKPNDKIHLGFSSEITGKKAIEDFKKFAANDVELVRVFLMGHLEGVFTWNESGTDIAEFGGGDEPLIERLGKMRVEELAEYLNKNDEAIFKRTEEGLLPGLEPKVLEDFFGLLAILEKVEKETGKKVYVILSMYDFMFADGFTREGPYGKYTVGEHPGIATDRNAKAKAEALIWKVLKILAKDERFHRYVACVEVMNEPANAEALATKENFTTLVNFVAENLYLFKDAVGPSIPVSVGFESWRENLKHWMVIGGGIDMMMPHYWESLESYNINKNGLWPLDAPSGELWENLGTKPEGRPTGIGEISPGGNLKKNLFEIEKAGYDFALAWSYSGHDGHDVKPVMDSIVQYQAGMRELIKLKKNDTKNLKRAFSYLLQLRSLFEAERKIAFPKNAGVNRDSDEAFLSYISKNMKDYSSTNFSEIIETIRTIAILKGVPLTHKNIVYLWMRARM